MPERVKAKWIAGLLLPIYTSLSAGTGSISTVMQLLQVQVSSAINSPHVEFAQVIAPQYRQCLTRLNDSKNWRQSKQ